MKIYNYNGFDADQLTPFFICEQKPKEVLTLFELMCRYDNLIIECKLSDDKKWTRVYLTDLTTSKNGVFYKYWDENKKELISDMNICAFNESEMESFYDEVENDYIVVIYDDVEGTERRYLI